VRLKSLEIKGFKSFADKTVINLDNQITGIVGPNGCGKSNIVDAIRWVIGEHKIKTLRSDNLEDLIFNGSKSRNGSGLAEVSLTFENTKNLLPTEFHTVTISRKFYKNGESEYRLNDVTCRLKDITNLFMDTGVTSDSYSIIELGMVDDIIKDKDNSRRRMLEQAAGISIYKTRKKEAKQKLDLTEQDLNRIEDLLFEIANNLRILESQAKKAEKYHSIKNEYKQVSVEYVKASLEDFNSSYQSLNEQQQQEVDKILGMESAIATEGAAVEALKLELIQREEELHHLQKSFNEVQHQLRLLENDQNLTAQRIEHLHQLKNNMDKSIAEATVQTENLLKATTQAANKLTHEEETLTQFKQKLDDLRSHLDGTRSVYDEQKKNLDQLRTQHQQLQIQQFDAEKKVAVAENTISNQQRIIHQLQEENSQRKTQIETTAQQKQEITLQWELKQEELKELHAKQAEATQKLLDSQAVLEEKRVLLFEENRKLDAKQNEYNLLKSLADSLEGYPDSIKFLTKHESWQTNAVLFSEILNVQDAHRVGIESYLDKYLNYYVVENAEQAYQAIHLLQDNEKGKAGFFILSEVPQRTSSTVSLPDAIPAIDVLQLREERYQPLLSYLLQNVYISPSEQLPETVPEQITLLSSKGTWFGNQYQIVGGSVGIFEGNKIGRSQRLEKLQEDILAVKTVVNSLQKDIEETKNLIVGYNQAAKDDSVKKAQDEKNRLENAQAQLEHRIENFSQQIEQSEKRTLELTGQLENTRSSIADTQIAYLDMKQQLTLAFSSLQESQEKFTGAEANYNKANEEYNQQNLIITRQQSRINEIQHERGLRENQLTEIAAKKAADELRLTETKQQLEETEVELKAVGRKIICYPSG
jgi:chromosome segregation protein